ncbi:SDR family oxidoreductase [Saprospiraceae bacterium]|nr:SDR family oxidoreductase [Saprospiraceae bacterium]MDB4768674.1 SDR family oxidoreductase [Saprospiraceae bacterium]MDG1433133.1 SDR family oxidoreductase [Saprospiraceae bacterium]
MDINLKGKNAFVGGSSKGIGKATAIELAKLGANITLVSRSADKMIDILHELDNSLGQYHDFLVVDFKDIENLKKRAHAIALKKDIHILVNNTGGPEPGGMLEAGLNDFLGAFKNHLICNHLLVKSFVNGMKRSGYGRIINIISTSVKEPLDGLGVSNTTRAAVANWAKTLANELGKFGITVNNVLPGFTDTERLSEILKISAEKNNISEEQMFEKMKQSVPLQRFAEPSELGMAISFLASPAASYITGTNLVVDGGRTKSH